MKVYFNNSCKICKAEINLYKKERIEEIDWIDITDNDLAEKETSKNSKELLRRLHVKDGEKVATPKGRGRGYRFGLDNEMPFEWQAIREQMLR